jgi:hypothetical protein
MKAIRVRSKSMWATIGGGRSRLAALSGRDSGGERDSQLELQLLGRCAMHVWRDEGLRERPRVWDDAGRSRLQLLSRKDRPTARLSTTRERSGSMGTGTRSTRVWRSS